MKQVLVLLVAMLSCTLTAVNGQVPSLDPAQTVNPATGEMGFSLPLGVVEGANGNSFPINLNYKAGILTSQQSSPAGLGFSYGAGSITRMTNFVPDDNEANDAQVDYSSVVCDETLAEKIFFIVSFVVSVLLYFVPGGVVISTIVTVYVSVAMLWVGSLIYTPYNYVTGGDHVPAYDYENNDGVGFLKADLTYDIPDNYFISTPYISGELVYASNAIGTTTKTNRYNGSFVLKTSQGTPLRNDATVKIDYNLENETFTIVKEDGTKLYFTLSDKVPSAVVVDWKDERCDGKNGASQSRAAATQWHLTKVVFPDGNEIIFDYLKVEGPYAYHQGLAKMKKSGTYSISGSQIGSLSGNEYVTFYFLKKIITTNQTAEFKYNDNTSGNYRKDIFWNNVASEANDDVSIFPVLEEINIKNSVGMILKTIKFESTYTLRPGTISAYKSSSDEPDPNNQSGSSLTLNLLKVSENNIDLPVTTFKYGYNPNAFPTRTTSNNQTYYNERADVWGYYNPNEDGQQDYADETNKTDPLGGHPYASAWSLSGMRFANGKSISWTYESNKYAYANNIQMKNAAGGNTTKIGGGIRVKEIKYNGGLKEETLSYFYTKMQTPGNFIENEGNSSGHATALPYPSFLQKELDVRPYSTRGGIYVPAKVAYEKIHIVKGFKANELQAAPFGYSTYEFVTSKEFANEGGFGQIDNSWCRGQLKSNETYNAKSKLISSVNYEYDYIGNTALYETKIPLVVGTTPIHRNYGILRSKNKREMVNGVEKITEFSYAKSTLDVDHRNALQKRFLTNVYENEFYISEKVDLQTTLFGDKQKADLVIALKGSSRIFLLIFPDIEDVAVCNSSKITIVKHLAAGSISFQKFGVVERQGDINKPEIYIVYSLNGVASTIALQDVWIDVDGTIKWTETATVGPTDLPAMNYSDRFYGQIHDNVFEFRFWVHLPRIYDYDGQPNQIAESSKDGLKRIIIAKPCYWDGATGQPYQAMLAKNMLAQKSQTTTYCTPGTTALPIDPSAWKRNVVSATATKWNDWGDGRWLPNASYAWNAELSAASPGAHPTADRDFVDFSHTVGAQNPNWVHTGGVDRRSDASSPTQTTNMEGVSSCVIISTDNTLPLLNVQNGKLGECLYTNWAENEPADLNLASYRMGTAGSDLHFAPRTMVLASNVNSSTGDQYALTDYTAVDESLPELANRSFIVEFWAKATGMTTPSVQSFIHLQAITSNSWSSHVYFELTPEWKKYEFELTFSGGVTTKQYRLVLRPPRKPNAEYVQGAVFYDDVRVTPKGSLSATTYYDQKWRTPILGLDANNNPGALVENDGFGRPTSTYKLNAALSQNNSGFKTLVVKKEYHLQDELLPGQKIRIQSPRVNDAVRCGTNLTISWINEGTKTVTAHRSYNGTTWTQIPNPVASVGWGSTVWFVPFDDVGKKCWFKVTDNEGNSYILQTPITLGAMRVTGPNGALYVDMTEVTQKDYETHISHNPNSPAMPDHPVSDVTWYDAVLYCNARSALQGLSPVYTYTSRTPATGWPCTALEGLQTDMNANGYRLPTIAEWKTAYGTCADDAHYWGLDDAIKYAWFGQSPTAAPYYVASKLPNEHGLYDMAGNVAEWVNDDYTLVHCTGQYGGYAYGGSYRHELAYITKSSFTEGCKSWNTFQMGFRAVRKAE